MLARAYPASVRSHPSTKARFSRMARRRSSWAGNDSEPAGACHCPYEAASRPWASSRDQRRTRLTARLYVGWNDDNRSGGGARAVRATRPNGDAADHSTKAWPTVSMPRLPARPVSCRYSPEVRAEVSAPRNFANRSTTTVRAGMLIPRASVAVANTTFSRPSEKHRSTAWRNAGTNPAWCGAMPASRAADHGPYPRGRQVVVAQPLDGGLGQHADTRPFLGRRKADAVLQALAGGVVTGRPREDEGDGRQHPGRRQVLHHLGPPGCPVPVPGIAPTSVVQGGAVRVCLSVAQQREHG